MAKILVQLIEQKTKVTTGYAEFPDVSEADIKANPKLYEVAVQEAVLKGGLKDVRVEEGDSSNGEILGICKEHEEIRADEKSQEAHMSKLRAMSDDELLALDGKQYESLVLERYQDAPDGTLEKQIKAKHPLSNYFQKMLDFRRKNKKMDEYLKR